MINAWKDKFGEEYTKRNQYDWRKRIPVYRKILSGLKISDALEVGSNCGFNLMALENLGIDAMGLEPNAYARKEADKKHLISFPGEAAEIPFKGDTCDLVFTSGVLIHVPPKELTKAMKEIIRVSRKYILAIEYEAPEETMIVYRGKRDMLWKRPFGRMYKKLGLTLVGQGKTPFDKCHYWLFQK